MKTYEMLTIDGIEITLTPRGSVSWSSNWGLDGIYRLKDQGYFRTQSGGRGTYGHVSFIITPKGNQAATRRTVEVA